ncbi:MAG: hypothetical protein MJ164_03650, partial [Alphaproteobacteria bacterium]|nr:hypothetical protein [Alphaproteobacteria bacterium]
FLRVFSKITIFACVFCAFPAWSDTTCDTNFTPIMGNSWQNGTPTPTNPVEVISVGDVNIIPSVDCNLAVSRSNWTTQNTGIYKIKAKFKYNSFTADKYNSIFGADNGMFFGRSVSGYWSPHNLRDSISPRITMQTGVWYEIEDILNRDTGAITGTINGTAYTSTRTARSPSDWYIGNFTTYTEYASFDGDIAYIDVYYNDVLIHSYRPRGSSFVDSVTQATITNTSWTEGSISQDGYRIPGTSIYLDEPLRKVGNYADELRPDGTVIRRVGVKVLNGTENWILSENATAIAPIAGMPRGKAQDGFCTHAINDKSTSHSIRFGWDDTYVYWFNVLSDYSFGDITTFKSWLAQQYANGTPVTVYYPLATEVVESWSCGPIADIKIATTKFVDDEFAAAEAKLAATVQTIENVVSRTITQTGQIQILQDTKQTRPDESCPANMKCLLVQDEDGTPHWYPIIEP